MVSPGSWIADGWVDGWMTVPRCSSSTGGGVIDDGWFNDGTEM